MRVRLRAFVLGLVLPACALLAFLYLSAFQIANEVWQEPQEALLVNLNPQCLEKRSGYCVLANYQPAQAIVGFDDSLTLTTQGTIPFLHHIATVCDRWQGPVSVSVYAPGSDFVTAKHLIETLRRKNDCVRKWVSWHLIYDASHSPTSQEMLSLADANVTEVHNSYIEKHHLVYPINVARNVARLNARTRYLLASDIELYPNKDIIPRFLEMVRRLESTAREAFQIRRQVFVLPVFEVSLNSVPPATKKQLVHLFMKKQAVSFHRYMCNTCHQIPDLKRWLTANSTQSALGIFLSTKRQRTRKLSSWEPFFIGTNKEPFFDERLSWNGKINKMQVAYEMCLLDYDFHILDEAFLTHAPGIKIFSAKEQAPRSKYMKMNHMTYKQILKELYAKYGYKEEC